MSAYLCILGRMSTFIGTPPSEWSWTIVEAAAYARVSERWIHTAAPKGLIPHILIPGFRQLRFKQEWLDRWLSGAPLEVEEIRNAKGKIIGRICRPVS